MPVNGLTRHQVPAAFDEVARRYDVQVDANPGYHANLRAAARALLGQPDRSASRNRSGPPPRYLDLGCGTGASTRALALELFRAGAPVDVLGADASSGMLDVARARRWPPGVDFVWADAADLAGTEEVAGPFDGVLAAYLLRNVPDADHTLREVHDILRPGGVLVLQDYSVRGRPAAGLLWTLVCWCVVIPLGWVTTGRTRLYRYLWRSAFTFDTLPRLTARLTAAGFDEIRVLPGLGWQRGILHTVVARRAAGR